MLLEQFLPNVSAGILLLEIGDRTFQFYQSLVELVIRETLQSIAQENIAGDVFRRIPIDRNSGEMQVSLVLVEIFQCHVLLGRHRNNSRSHHIAGLHLVQLHDILDDFVLVRVYHTLLQTDVRHRRNLVPAHGRLVLILAQQIGNQLDNDDKRPHQYCKERDHRCHETHQILPVCRSYSLRDNLRKHQHQQCCQCRNDTEPGTSEQYRRLTAHSRRAQSVRDCVQ